MLSYIIDGFCCFSYKVAATDTSQALDVNKLESNGRLCRSVLITVEGNSIRVGHGNAPIQSTGIGHLFNSGDIIFLNSGIAAKQFRFVKASASDSASIQVSVFF